MLDQSARPWILRSRLGQNTPAPGQVLLVDTMGELVALYAKAQIARRRIASDFADVFASGVDLLFTPTTPTTAFKAGERLDDPVAMYLADVFVCSANLAGIPAISLPVGRAGGLPIGGQFMAKPFAEADLFQATNVIEHLIDGDEELQ